MQAEFGNFDAERHTAHYLKDFQLFPKVISQFRIFKNKLFISYFFQTFTDSTFLETLTEAASRQHAALHNLPQGTAEEYYICACQRLDGYGQEVYAVRDSGGLEATIGICLTGIHIGNSMCRETRHFG